MRSLLTAFVCIALLLVLFVKPHSRTIPRHRKRRHHHHAGRLLTVSDKSSVKLPRKRSSFVVEGRVVLADGKPAPFARLTVTTADSNSFSLSCDMNGNFKFILPKPQCATISAHFPNHITAHASVRPHQTHIVITIPHYSCVTVSVKDSLSKTAISGADVMLVTRVAEKVIARATETSVPGVYLFPKVDFGLYGLRVDKNGYWTGRTLVRVDEPQEHIDVALSAGAWVRGQVVDDTGGAVGDVLVVAGRTGKETVAEKPEATTRTNPNGHFSLFLPAGEIYIWAEKKGYAPAALEGLRLTQGESISGLRLLLHRGLTLCGTVLDETARPVADASVTLTARIFHSLHPFLKRSTRTDKKGHFRFTNLPDADYWLEVHHPNFLLYKHPHLLRLEARQNLKDVVVKLSRGVSVSGVVLDTAGNPVGGALVCLRRIAKRGQPLQTERTTRTNEEGHFTIRGLAEEEYKLTVRTSRYGLVSIRIAAPQENLVVRLKQRGDIIGWVLREGRPVSGVEVVAKNANLLVVTKTDENGFFRLKDLTASKWLVGVRIAERIVVEKDVDLLPPQVQLTLSIPP